MYRNRCYTAGWYAADCFLLHPLYLDQKVAKLKVNLPSLIVYINGHPLQTEKLKGLTSRRFEDLKPKAASLANSVSPAGTSLKTPSSMIDVMIKHLIMIDYESTQKRLKYITYLSESAT